MWSLWGNLDGENTCGVWSLWGNLDGENTCGVCMVTVGKSRWGEHMWCVGSLDGENTCGVWEV